MAVGGDKVAIALIQMSCAPEPRLNLDKAIARIEEGAKRGAQIVCMQELFRSHYPCQTEDPKFFDLAEPIPGPTTEALGKLAAARKIVIVASIFERRAAGVYHNTAAVIDETGKVIGRYRKMHIPDDPRYYET
jgi:N-carbamoylputrescine amidase